MNIGTFEVMNESEMMAVNGGTRSRKERKTATKAAKERRTSSEARNCARYVVPLSLGLASPLFSGTGAIIAGGVGVAAGYYL